VHFPIKGTCEGQYKLFIILNDAHPGSKLCSSFGTQRDLEAQTAGWHLVVGIDHCHSAILRLCKGRRLWKRSAHVVLAQLRDPLKQVLEYSWRQPSHLHVAVNFIPASFTDFTLCKILLQSDISQQPISGLARNRKVRLQHRGVPAQV